MLVKIRRAKKNPTMLQDDHG